MSATAARPAVRTVEVRGARVRVAETGTGDPLLLINGIGAGLETWAPVAPLLAERHRLIMFDVPGTGGSPALPRPLRMAGLARFVASLLDVFGTGPVDLLGFSWGGVLAQQLAHDAPERVRRLVLVSSIPGIGGLPPSAAVLGTAMLSPPRYASARQLSAVAPVIYGREVRDSAAGREWLRSLLVSPASGTGYLHQLYAVAGWTSLTWLHRIVQPTLVICGDEDPLVPARNARLLARGIPHAELLLLRGGGHLRMFLQPAEVADPVNRFLGRAK